MSSGKWVLEPNAEREYLLPWLESEPDSEIRERVLLYLASLLKDPFRPALEDDDSGVFSLRAVPKTNVGLIWTLDMEGQQVVLAHVG